MTLSEFIALCRDRLDDTNSGGYLWSNDILTEHANEILNTACRKLALILDTTTPAICEINVTIDDEVLAISDRIVRVHRAKLDGSSIPLMPASITYMDQNLGDWENADANIPRYYIWKGVERDTIRLWPKASEVDVLRLRTYRLPLADLSWETDQGTTLETPERYHNLYVNGVCWLAYSKQDTDTANGKKAQMHYALHERDMNEIRKAELDYNYSDTVVQPLLGAM